MGSAFSLIHGADRSAGPAYRQPDEGFNTHLSIHEADLLLDLALRSIIRALQNLRTQIHDPEVSRDEIAATLEDIEDMAIGLHCEIDHVVIDIPP